MPHRRREDPFRERFPDLGPIRIIIDSGGRPRPTFTPPPQVNVPPGPDRPPPEVPTDDFPRPPTPPSPPPSTPPQVPPGGAGGFVGPPPVVAPPRIPPVAPPGSALETRSIWQVVVQTARVIGRGPLILGGILFPSEVAPGVPTEEELEELFETRGFEPPQPEPEIITPEAPIITQPQRERLPSRSPQRVIPAETPPPLPAIRRRPFPVERPPPVEIPPEPGLEPEPRRVQPFEIPSPEPVEREPLTEVPPPSPLRDPTRIERTQAQPAPPRTSQAPSQRRAQSSPVGRVQISPFLLPPIPSISRGRQRSAQRERTPLERAQTEEQPLGQEPPIGTDAPPDLTTFQPSDLTSQPPTSRGQQRCEEVKRRRRRKGKCREGFFRELPGKTQFITWREGDCVSIARKGAQEALISEVKKRAGSRLLPGGF